MADPFIGEIRVFGGNYAPLGWAFCDGATLSIQSYTALFSIIGTTYGGDGRTTFALPDLRGRAPVGMGSGPSLSSRALGEKSGNEEETLTTNHIPPLSGAVNATPAYGTSQSPTGGYVSHHTDNTNAFATSGGTDMAADSINFNSSGGQAHTNMQPFLAVNYIIALGGSFPSRN